MKAPKSKSKKAATIRTLWGVQTVAFCFNGSSSFPLSLSLFPALSACRYSNRFNRPFGNQQFFFLFSDLTVLSVVLLFLDCQLMKLLIQ